MMWVHLLCSLVPCLKFSEYLHNNHNEGSRHRSGGSFFYNCSRHP
jgi:hypothetical protein